MAFLITIIPKNTTFTTAHNCLSRGAVKALEEFHPSCVTASWHVRITAVRIEQEVVGALRQLKLEFPHHEQVVLEQHRAVGSQNVHLL